MSDSQPTFGDFFAEVENTEITEAQTFLEDYVKRGSPEQWKQLQALPLTVKLVCGFASDVAIYYRGIIEGTCGEDLYNRRLTDGHQLLRDIYTAATKMLNVYIPINNVDTPLTMLEFMVTSGYAKIIEPPIKLFPDRRDKKE